MSYDDNGNDDNDDEDDADGGRETLITYLQWHGYIILATLIPDPMYLVLFYKHHCILLILFLKSVLSPQVMC